MTPVIIHARPPRSTSSLLILLALSLLALVSVIQITSCGVPVAIVVQGQYGTYGYSSKSGITATIHPDK